MRSTLSVHGFEFVYADLVWDSCAMHHAPYYVCREIESGLISHGGGHWSCRICKSEGTGDSAEDAVAAAYRALDARVDRLTSVLNVIHERTGIQCP